MWSFVHPGIAAAAAGLVLIPIAIHLLSRRRYQQEPWAAMLFLHRAHRRTRHRTRIEQWLLLALRTAAMLLIALAVAQPLIGAKPTFGLGRQPRTERILIIDNSASMRAPCDDGRSAYDHARDAALKLAATFGPSDAISVITTAWPARVIMNNAPLDDGAIRRALADQPGTFAKNDLATALDRAREAAVRSELPADRRAAYLVTNLCRSDWLDNRAASSGESSTQLNARRLTEVSRLTILEIDPQSRDNAAIVGLTCTDRLVGCEWPIALAADVAAFTEHPLPAAQLEIRVDGRVVRTLPVAALAAGEVRRVPFTVSIEHPGSRVVSVRLLGPADALPYDDARYLSIDVARGMRVLAVDGRSVGSQGGDSFYFARALAPSNSGDAAHFQVQSVGEFELHAADLRTTAIVVLANVRSLPADQWKRLTRFVRDGGGLFVAAADQADPENYNRAARELLPAALVRIDERNPDAPDLPTLQIADASHPVLADFGAQPIGGLLTAKFSRAWRVEPAAEAHVLLRFTNGDTALVERSVGRGRVMLWTSSLNMAWNNLPARPDFVTLMLNIAGSLSARADAWRNVLVGESAVEPLRQAARGNEATLRTPDGRQFTLPIASDDGRLEVRVPGRGPDGSTDEPGVYELTVNASTAKLCVNVSPAVCDLRRWTREDLRASFGESIGWANAADPLAAITQRAAASAATLPLLIVLFAVLLIETFVALGFGHRRA